MKKNFNEELELLEQLLQECDMTGTEEERREFEQLIVIAKLVSAENRRFELLGENSPYDFSTFLSGLLTERLQAHLRKESDGRYEVLIFDNIFRRQAAAVQIEISELNSILIQDFRFC